MLKMNQLQAAKFHSTLKNEIYLRAKSRKTTFKSDDESEFNNIFTLIKEFRQSKDKLLELKVSENFQNNWIELILNTYFKHNASKRILKSEAKEMAKLYMSIYDQEFPDHFLENYRHYLNDL